MLLMICTAANIWWELEELTVPFTGLYSKRFRQEHTVI
jgi:hypothetical protein